MIPVLQPHLTVVRDDGASVRIRRPDGRELELDKVVAGLLLSFNGVHDCRELQRDLELSGAPVPGGFVTSIAKAMAEEGLVSLHAFEHRPRRIRSMGSLKTACVGCGRSCESHAIGPLDDATVERIESCHTQLARDIPELAGTNATLRDDACESPGGRSMDRFVSRVDTRCIYLKEDHRCLLHEHFGAEAKPSICRIWGGVLPRRT